MVFLKGVVNLEEKLLSENSENPSFSFILLMSLEMFFLLSLFFSCL